MATDLHFILEQASSKSTFQFLTLTKSGFLCEVNLNQTQQPARDQLVQRVADNNFRNIRKREELRLVLRISQAV